VPWYVLLLALLFVAGANNAPANEPETVCVQCHGGQSGRLGEPVKLWKGSIHAANGISCHGCHGGDPSDMAMAMSRERGFLGKPADSAIPSFCGRCHLGVKEDYLASAHGRALGRGGPHCVTCHGNHRVMSASPDLINRESCTRCHDYGRAEEIRTAVTDIDRKITALEQSLAGLHRTGIATKEMDDDLFALRNRFHRLFHNVDVEKVRSQSAGFQGELRTIRARVDAIDRELRQRKLWGGGVVALLILSGLVALLLHKTYQDKL
jgi:Cytochrome c3